MKKFGFSETKLWKGIFIALISTSLLSACGGSSSSDDDDNSGDDTSNGSVTLPDGFPEGVKMSFIDASSPQYMLLDTEASTLVDLNDLAASSSDSAVQKLAISDTSSLSHVYHWPDFRMVNDEEMLDMKYLVMNPTYTYQSGTNIDSTHFQQLTHLHGEDLAAHSADEFENPEPGSNKEMGLARLNASVAEQEELENELSDVLPEGQTLCRAYIDPYVKFEHEQEEAEESVTASSTAEEAHEHGDLMHFALTQSGRIYFYQEDEETETLASSQGFVVLDSVTSIANCSRTTIARVSEDGIVVFIPDTQKLYLVDSHGGDFHEHSNWDLSDILPAGFNADMMALIGESEAHDHDHE